MSLHGCAVHRMSHALVKGVAPARLGALMRVSLTSTALVDLLFSQLGHSLVGRINSGNSSRECSKSRYADAVFAMRAWVSAHLVASATC